MSSDSPPGGDLTGGGTGVATAVRDSVTAVRGSVLRILPVPMLAARSGGGMGGRGGGHLIERHARVYRRAWVLGISGVFEPLFYLLSVGVGIGSLVGAIHLPGGQVVGFTSFVAPGLLATSAMNGAIADSTFNVFFRLKYAKLYDSALATPMRSGDVALGEVGWALLRGGIYAVSFEVVMAALGLLHSPWSAAVVPAALLIGFAFAGAGMAATTFITSWQHFEFITLATLPMFLFSATFYPLAVYPRALQIVVECTPLYQGVALMRALTLGTITPAALGNIAYLAILGLAGLAIASRRISRLLLT